METAERTFFEHLEKVTNNCENMGFTNCLTTIQNGKDDLMDIWSYPIIFLYEQEIPANLTNETEGEGDLKSCVTSKSGVKEYLVHDFGKCIDIYPGMNVEAFVARLEQQFYFPVEFPENDFNDADFPLCTQSKRDPFLGNLVVSKLKGAGSLIVVISLAGHPLSSTTSTV